MNLIKWTHPVLGRIAEYACDSHAEDLLKALHTLGMGCTSVDQEHPFCYRCIYAGYSVREWVEDCVQ